MPVKKVCAKDKIAKGGLVFVPLSTSIRAVNVGGRDCGEKEGHASAEIYRYKCPARGTDIKIVAFSRLPLTPAALAASTTPDPEHNFVVPYWCVRRTQDKAKANMEYVSTSINVGNMKLQIPVMKNIDSIGPGEECLLYEEDCKKAVAPASTAQKRPLVPKGKGKAKAKGKDGKRQRTAK